MPVETKLIIDSIGVGAIGITGQPTTLIPAQPFDRRVWLYSPAPGVYVSHQQLRLSSQGFELPSTVIFNFDMPAGSTLFAIATMGTIQVSRFMSPVLSTVPTEMVNAVVRPQPVAPVTPTSTPRVSHPASELEALAYMPPGPMVKGRP